MYIARLILTLFFAGSCLKGFAQSQKQTPAVKKAAPDYALIFPDSRVNTLEITLSKAEWDSINADMKNKFGNEFGKGGRFPGREMMPKGGQRPPMPSERSFPPMGPPPGGEGGFRFGKGEPDYVAVALKFNGRVWNNVGFRLKGNSTLMMSWGQGIYKLPFRLSFDAFSTQFPDTKDRRFYGFKELSMAPGANDNSLIREKVAADIFRMAGVAAARTAFYKVYIDFGEGKKYCGVYTMVEVIDDTMVKTQFGEDSGNIYKPESTFERFSAKQMEKKNNKKQADYGDVQAFVQALNDSTRLTDPAQWRATLEQTFNVRHFLKYLAVNNVMTNWDTYGAMPHNFYLYNSPAHKLTWIPWDHNEAMSSRDFNGPPPMAGMGPPPEGFRPPDGFGPPPGFAPPMGGRGMGGSVPLDLTGVSNRWPLIRYLADDPVYFAQYKQYVKVFSEQVFTAAKMQPLFARNHALIAPFVTDREKEERPYSHLRESAAFVNSLLQLNRHVEERQKQVKAFLKEGL